VIYLVTIESKGVIRLHRSKCNVAAFALRTPKSPLLMAKSHCAKFYACSTGNNMAHNKPEILVPEMSERVFV